MSLNSINNSFLLIFHHLELNSHVLITLRNMPNFIIQ